MCFTFHIFKMELIQQNLNLSSRNILGCISLSNTYPFSLISYFPVSPNWDPESHIWPIWFWIIGYSQWTRVDDYQVRTSQNLEFDLKSTSWSCELEMRQLRTTHKLTPWSQVWREGELKGVEAQIERKIERVVTTVTDFFAWFLSLMDPGFIFCPFILWDTLVPFQ